MYYANKIIADYEKGSKFTSLLMVNFICQLDQVREYSDIWSNIIVSVTLKAFLSEINIQIRRQSKAEWPP